MADEVVAALRAALTPFLNVASLTDLYTAYKSIPFNWALAGHCLFVATLAGDVGKHRCLLHFWLTFLAGFGGGVLSSLLMMDPVRAPINVLANNTVGITYLVCWWLINYSPFDIVGRLHSLLPVRLVTKACVSFLRANLIINRVDLAVTLFPGVLAAPLILGTLAGSGGKLITDAIRGGWGLLPGPAEASVPTFVWRSAALASAAYYGLAKATGLLSSQEAAALVITVLLVHSVLSDLLGASATDFTYPLARVAHAVSLVPMPSAAPAPAAAKAAKKAAAPAPQQPAAAASSGAAGAKAAVSVGAADKGKAAAAAADKPKPAAAPAAAPAAPAKQAPAAKPAGGKNAAAGAAAPAGAKGEAKKKGEPAKADSKKSR